jgi:predicted transcriptional regulator
LEKVKAENEGKTARERNALMRQLHAKERVIKLQQKKIAELQKQLQERTESFHEALKVVIGGDFPASDEDWFTSGKNLLTVPSFCTFKYVYV